MGQELKESITTLLEFYKEFGFDRLPLNLSQKTENRKQKTEDRDSEIQGFKEEALNALREEIGDCQRCRLSKERTHIVFGEGNVNSKIMFIGEAPGRDEDIQGRPFVGEAGQILTSLINKMGEASGLNFTRKDVYIANIVKCRPPGNRDPQEDEMSVCSPFLERQVEIISPEVIMALGRISAYTLLDVQGPISKFSITKARGRFYEYKGIPVMPTFHPAYFLRNPKDKSLTWADAQAVLKKIGLKG
ncbi:MAG: uracil-DNA glycosylase [Thermodesulfovibrionales bacterium]|nr:uracil-DNA glycosylase [Thermodesulfovibrionales bacterium]